LTLRTVDDGYFVNKFAGRMGRDTKAPAQFGQRPPSTPSAQLRQKVHSNEQIMACGEDGGKSTLQHSQFGRSSSMDYCLG
jgi:hypothetical protein